MPVSLYGTLRQQQSQFTKTVFQIFKCTLDIVLLKMEIYSVLTHNSYCSAIIVPLKIKLFVK